MTELGKVLEALRTRITRLSQDEVAAALKTSRTTVSLWETGTHSPRQLAPIFTYWQRHPMCVAWLRLEHLEEPDVDSMLVEAQGWAESFVQENLESAA